MKIEYVVNDSTGELVSAIVQSDKCIRICLDEFIDEIKETIGYEEVYELRNTKFLIPKAYPSSVLDISPVVISEDAEWNGLQTTVVLQAHPKPQLIGFLDFIKLEQII